MTLLSQVKPKARKDHYCDGCDQIDRNIGWQEVIEELKETPPVFPHKINKGEVYIKQNIADGGDMYTWKSCQVCFDIIIKHELYDPF